MKFEVSKLEHVLNFTKCVISLNGSIRTYSLSIYADYSFIADYQVPIQMYLHKYVDVRTVHFELHILLSWSFNKLFTVGKHKVKNPWRWWRRIETCRVHTLYYIYIYVCVCVCAFVGLANKQCLNKYIFTDHILQTPQFMKTHCKQSGPELSTCRKPVVGRNGE